MGCNCGKKRQKFQKVTQNTQTPKEQTPINILETPDHLLTPRQLRNKQRYFRIKAREARIARRNAMAAKLQKANLNSQNNIS